MKDSICHIFYSLTKFGGVHKYIDNIRFFSKFNHYCLNLNDHGYLKFSNFKLSNKYSFKKKKFKIIHFHGFIFPIFFNILKINDFKIFWTPHFHPPKFTKRPLLSLLNFLFCLLIIGKKMNIICQYNDEKIIFKKLFFRSKVFLCPTGHNFVKQYKKNKIYDGIYIARNESNKNLKLFIELVKKNKKNFFCLITDNCNIKLNNLDIFNYVSENKKIDLILKSKFFINVSKFEAFGIASAEAELLGVPSIYNENCKYNIFKTQEQSLKFVSNNLDSLNNIFKQCINLNKKKMNKIKSNLKKKSLSLIFEKKIYFFDHLYNVS